MREREVRAFYIYCRTGVHPTMMAGGKKRMVATVKKVKGPRKHVLRGQAGIAGFLSK
jgi:hypothetical protein